MPSKRRAYDSVDPEFDDQIPDQFSTSKQTKKDFFSTFAEAFERNGRWSTRTPVPKLGKDDMSREAVDKFYKFWYAFESWREYSYLDEEDKESGSDRDERRWIEKNNRVQRAERKKEEMKRIRTLVDNAYNSDPRVIRFREGKHHNYKNYILGEFYNSTQILNTLVKSTITFILADKQEKADRKKAKADAAKARRDEEERIKREAEEKERAEKEAKELEEKKRLDAEKKEKEIQKKALKKEKRELRGLTKDNDFYCAQAESGSQSIEEEKVVHMTELDRLCEILSAIELESLNSKLKSAADKSSARLVFIDAYTSLNAKLEKEKLATIEKASGGSNKGAGSSSSKGGDWSNDELALLIKAVNLFPAGTNQRWEVVANFVNQHTQTPLIVRNAKETLAKAKELQSGNFHLSSLKEDANKRAYENLEKQKKKDIKVYFRINNILVY